MSLTKYNHLSSAELIQSLHDKREYSDLIEELCSRLEDSVSICPICEGDIESFKKEN